MQRRKSTFNKKSKIFFKKFSLAKDIRKGAFKPVGWMCFLLILALGELFILMKRSKSSVEFPQTQGEVGGPGLPGLDGLDGDTGPPGPPVSRTPECSRVSRMKFPAKLELCFFGFLGVFLLFLFFWCVCVLDLHPKSHFHPVLFYMSPETKPVSAWDYYCPTYRMAFHPKTNSWPVFHIGFHPSFSLFPFSKLNLFIRVGFACLSVLRVPFSSIQKNSWV